MHRPYRQRITILSSLCLLLFGVGFAAMSTLPSPVGAALQGASSTPFFTPALKSTLIPLDDFQSSAGFGSAVSTSHGIILVGAPHAYSNQGTAYIFDQPTPDNWQQTAELVAPDGDPGDLFGSAVSIDTGATGMVAVVGAPGDDAAGLDAGAVYVYMLNGQNHWTLTARINAPDAAPATSSVTRSDTAMAPLSLARRMPTRADTAILAQSMFLPAIRRIGDFNKNWTMR